MPNIEINSNNHIVATTPEGLKAQLTTVFEKLIQAKSIDYVSVKYANDDSLLRVDTTQGSLQCWHYSFVERKASPVLSHVIKEFLPNHAQLTDYFHDFYDIVKSDIINRTLTGEQRERLDLDQAINELESAVRTNQWEQLKESREAHAKLQQALVKPMQPQAAQRGFAGFRLFSRNEKEPASTKEAKAKSTSTPPKIR